MGVLRFERAPAPTSTLPTDPVKRSPISLESWLPGGAASSAAVALAVAAAAAAVVVVVVAGVGFSPVFFLHQLFYYHNNALDEVEEAQGGASITHSGYSPLGGFWFGTGRGDQGPSHHGVDEMLKGQRGVRKHQGFWCPNHSPSQVRRGSKPHLAYHKRHPQQKGSEICDG